MSFQILISRVEIEKVLKGKGYEKATVHYSYKGESRTQSLVSFSNPSVFDAIKRAVEGDIFEIDTVKEGKFTVWSSAVPVESGSVPTAPKRVDATPKSGTWETAEERAYKQVLIVRQSCLAQAVAYMNVDPATESTDQVLTVAQKFVDWIFSDSTYQGSQEPA